MKRKGGQTLSGFFTLTALVSALVGVSVLFFNSRYCAAVSYKAVGSMKYFFPETAFESFEKVNTEKKNAVILNDSRTEKEASVSGYTAPEDILNMQKQFKTEYASAEHSGAILERQYNAENASSVFENICVRNTTPSHSINIEKSLNSKLYLDIKDKSQPTVLIFHTHTTESYEMLDEGWFTDKYSTRSKDHKRNMVRVGDAICEELQKNNIGVIHDTEIHDLQYTGAYERSRASVEKILKQYPSIKITLDVHRDAIYLDSKTRVKAVSEINGVKSAQIMIIAGCEDGKVKEFPDWEKNLTFDLRLQKKAENMYPGLMRPVLFSARKYNMDLTPCSALLEFGSDSNTLGEAVYAGHLFGQVLSEFIKENEKGER